MKYNNKILGVAWFIRATLRNWLVFKECPSPESSSLIETYSFCCWEESAVPHLGLRNTQMQRRSATSELGCYISNSFEIPDIWDSRGAIPEDLSAFIFLLSFLLFLIGAWGSLCCLQPSVLVNILAQWLVQGKDATQAVCYYCIFLGHPWNHRGGAVL